MANNNGIIKEVKRKLMHAAGIIAVMPLIYLNFQQRLQVMAIFVLVALLLHWYWDRRNMRNKYIDKIISEIPDPHRHEIIKGTAQIRRFEEEVVFGFMKDVTRKREKEPMLATFYYLLSTLLALIFFGAPYAVFGLFAIAIGDCAATLVGKPFGKHKIFWNREKSVEGWIGFFAATAFSIFAFLHLFPQYAVYNPLSIAVIAGVAGAMIETIPTVNDNTSIPLGVAAVIWLFSFI